MKQEEDPPANIVKPYRNPSPPILHPCPLHPQAALEAKETETQWGHWEYYKCPVQDCLVCCGAQDMPSFLESVQRQLHDFYRQLQPDKLKCFCINTPRMCISRTERNPNRLFLNCSSHQCEFFQWIDEYPRAKNRAWLLAEKFLVLFDGKVVKRKREDILYETPLQKTTRQSIDYHMGLRPMNHMAPFEGNWDPQVTPKEQVYLEKRGLDNQSNLKDEIKKEDDLCFILDLEGFFINKTFHVRELGYYTWNEEYGRHAFFIPIPYNTLSDKDKRTVHFVMNKIHGLPYQPGPEEHAQHRFVGSVVKDLYQAYKTPERTVVGYKGGHVEKDILRQLNIPSLNLETLGCPKYDVLRRVLDTELLAPSCGFHTDDDHHCPIAECSAFWQWYKFGQ